MRFATPLVSARLIRRYMRFLSDMELEDGSVVKAHCPNPGSMMGLKDEGIRVWIEGNDDPKKKLDWGWRLIELDDAFVGIDTGAANGIVAEALSNGIADLGEYETIRPEVKYREKSRVDFLLSAEGRRDCYLEVKSVTLSRETGLAEFPDSVTARGAKHLGDLAAMVEQGHRAVLLFLVQRTDCTHVTLAADLDPTYAAAFKSALAAGVEVMCFDCTISPEGISLANRLPFG
ncbi:sugar fermentation stimulation protein A [Octadecabacter temperatus]|uniref:Sugar fermentation stimulation protein homolog n=1 Tax=Octadecabacter temperatus TaxID=1458307 RepID=A0A0K0Y1F1_9RHOB|nr:DNA/RNA nuclease SfsA [Octadecabacter temperatus]AKS44706.1 Sugar fermentation stimulation protein A [Octadecabacter temperatus]SIO36222.1 sugar fermentation stimulation protein A [Octadecabacter temperatus]